MTREELQKLIEGRITQLKTNKHRAAIHAGLPQNAIKYLLAGHSPKFERLNDICDALGLEIEIREKPEQLEYLNKTRFNSEKKVIDEQRLRNAIEICEQGLNEADKTLLPEKKARLIIVIYSMIGKANTVAAIKPEVIRLIHLAA